MTPTTSRKQRFAATANSAHLFSAALLQNDASPTANKKADENKTINASTPAGEPSTTAAQRPVDTVAESVLQPNASGASQLPPSATASASPLPKTGCAVESKPFSNFQFTFDSGIGHLWDLEAYLLRPFFNPPVPGEPIVWQYMLIRLPVEAQDIRSTLRELSPHNLALVSLCDLFPEEYRVVMEKVDEKKAHIVSLQRMLDHELPTTIGVFKIRSFILVLKTPKVVNNQQGVWPFNSVQERFQSFVAHPPFNDNVSPEEVRWFVEHWMRQDPSTLSVSHGQTGRGTWGGASYTPNVGGSGFVGAGNSNPQGFGVPSSNFVASTAPVASGRRFGDPYPQLSSNGYTQPFADNTSSVFGVVPSNHEGGFGSGPSPGLFGTSVRHANGFGSGSTTNLSGTAASSQGGFFGSGNYSSLFGTAAPSQHSLSGTGNPSVSGTGAPHYGGLFGAGNASSTFGTGAANNGGGFGSTTSPGLFGKVSGNGVNQNVTCGSMQAQSSPGSQSLFSGLPTHTSSTAPAGSPFQNNSFGSTWLGAPQGGSGLFGKVAATPSPTGITSATPGLSGGLPATPPHAGTASTTPGLFGGATATPTSTRTKSATPGLFGNVAATPSPTRTTSATPGLFGGVTSTPTPIRTTSTTSSIFGRPCLNPSHNHSPFGTFSCPDALQPVQSNNPVGGSLFANRVGQASPSTIGSGSLFGATSIVPSTPAGVWIPTNVSRATTPVDSASVVPEPQSKSSDPRKSLPAKPQSDGTHSTHSAPAVEGPQDSAQSKSNSPSKPSEKPEGSKSEGKNPTVEDVDGDNDENEHSVSKISSGIADMKV